MVDRGVEFPGVGPFSLSEHFMRQATTLTAKMPFVFKANNRRVTVAAGQRFWVTNTEVDQAKHGHITIARERDSMHYRWPFTPADIATYFEAA
jgi:hypothetical protein